MNKDNVFEIPENFSQEQVEQRKKLIARVMNTSQPEYDWEDGLTIEQDVFLSIPTTTTTPENTSPLRPPQP